ncbi:diguanylate cyclase [Nitrincola iocasae]|uniref:diguanylate cyclase n=2 Tax=Nitrincola iocasae TaxID=2614693 RepID=A0A5J6LB15_9GAMM|nr:diguanylate cyclase [Nitrincola iocasae]
MRRKRMPRLTRINYTPRVLGFGAIFVAISWLTYVRDWSAGLYVLAAVYFLLYPHCVYWFDRLRESPKGIEISAMLFDAFMLALWTVAIEFSGWVSFTLLATVILNNTMTGGVPQFIRAAACYGLGLLVGALLFGVHWSPEAPLGIEIITMVALQVYIFVVARVLSIQNQRLFRTKNDAEKKNVIFLTMLKLTDLGDQSETLELLVDEALKVLQGLYPNQSFGFVLKDPDESDTLNFAAYTSDLDEEQRALLRCQLSRVCEYLPKGQFVSIADQDDNSFVFPLKQRVDRFQGLLLIHGRKLPEEERQSMRLLLKQLSTTIANKLLSLELKSAAERDALTGIYNRGRLEQEIADAEARLRDNMDAHFSVILIDLIGLKPINDQYGHIAGDQLICSVANALRATCREHDRLFRFGGDEFVILCRDETGQGARALVKRIDHHVKGQKVSLSTDQGAAMDVRIELSVGLAHSDQVPPEDVLKRADERMYEDKKRWYAERDRYR